MTRDEAVPPPGDLLLQAVEGMERPLFVLDESWRFSYMNPAGARALDRTVDALVGREIWTSSPRRSAGRSRSCTAACGPRAGPAASRPGSARSASGSEADAFLTEAGLVVTYDDITERRRTEEERADAVAAREAAGGGGGRGGC